MTDVYYASFYGSTKQYADALAAQLGVNPQEISDKSASLIDAAAADPIAVLAPIHGPAHAGVKLIKELPEDVVRRRPIALATVGMTLEHVAYDQDPAGKLLGNRATAAHRFYLPGRLFYSELSRKHRNIMKGVVTAMKVMRSSGENERMMIETYRKDVDRVDLTRIEPIAQWVGNHT